MRRVSRNLILIQVAVAIIAAPRMRRVSRNGTEMKKVSSEFAAPRMRRVSRNTILKKDLQMITGRASHEARE